jgi:hypothetical protein
MSCNQICTFVGSIAKRQAHGRSGLAASAMLFSAKRESKESRLAEVLQATKLERRVPVPLLFSFKPCVEHYD